MQVQIPLWIRAAVIVIIAIAVTWRQVVDVVVDWMWFDALGYLAVYRTTLFTRAGLMAGGFAVASGTAGFSLWLAGRRAPIQYVRLQMAAKNSKEGISFDANKLKQLVRFGTIGVAILTGTMFAQVAGATWLEVLSALNHHSFGAVDPVFGHDVSFYVFVLPLLMFAKSLAIGVLTITGLITAGWYLLAAASANPQRPQLSDAGRRHLLGIGALLFLATAGGWWLARYELLFGSTGAVVGVGYADEMARLPGFLGAALLAVGVAGALVVAMRQTGWRTVLIAVAVYMGGRFVLTRMLPEITEQYVVQPSQLELERPYLQRNIEGTRTAYALDRVDVRPFEAESGLTMDDIRNNPLTIDNIRVWDTRPLLTTYAQLQEIRSYYDFTDVDVDRYTIDGSPRQVMLAVREMNVERLPGAGNWVNRHLQYTHGYGLTMSPVNVVTPDGLPELFVQDIPPTATIDMRIDRPEVYYGEATHDYVIVRTGEQEFDYPMGDQNVYTTYEGRGGVVLNSGLRTIMFAGYLENLDLLLSQYIQRDSRVLLHRSLTDRIRRVAPFLSYDADPYAVVSEGRIKWVVDAYTTSGRYPYSESTRIPNQGVTANYIRNSVKVVVDAYDGTIAFYISDDSDPIVRTYADIFPGTFLPIEEMPADLRSHLRYPSDFFDTQAELYRQYHMQDSTVFFNREDLWELPTATYAASDTMDSYYLIMKLPGEDTAEFINLVPFVPRAKDNLIAWMAARSDGEHYGKLIVYTFPKQKLIFGPAQVESRFDQTPEISEQLTLWDQAGSSVVRGNLLVIPIEDSLMYVEPIYLQAGNSEKSDKRRELPELKRVIVTHGKKIAMAPTLDEALEQVFNQMPDNVPTHIASRAPSASPPGEASQTATTERTKSWLVTAARNKLQEAEDKQRAGDWAGYGESLMELKALLIELDAATQPTPAAVPEGRAASPAE